MLIEVMNNNKMIDSREKTMIMVGWKQSKKQSKRGWVKLNTDGACMVGSSS